MTLGYVPGETFAHGLDPRSKGLFQAGFAAAAFAHTAPPGLAVLTALAVAVLALSGTPLASTLREYRALVPFLVGAPILATLRIHPPYVTPAAAAGPALASYRVVLLLLVSAAYVRTTSARESRAAIQRSIPGRPGVLLGAGVGFVLRFLPVLRRDLATVREATRARLGDRRSLADRVRVVGETGLRRAFRRADGFALALQARCFSWNPTLPPLRFGRRDVPVVALAVALAASALV
ncbi:MAG: energy-coupling factor transporter transmembrane protein EcfT [Salinigranum sp.]